MDEKSLARGAPRSTTALLAGNRICAQVEVAYLPGVEEAACPVLWGSGIGLKPLRIRSTGQRQ